MTEFDIRQYNQHAWNRQVGLANRWTVPVDGVQIAAARAGDVHVVLTPNKPVPRAWFPALGGCETLCLASGGGQQGPLLAAAGANVTVLDNSTEQLAQDRHVAAREGLAIRTVEGDMRDLSEFEDASFDLVFHPCSISFVPDVAPVWREVMRVLRPGAIYLLGACNPAFFIFDYAEYESGNFVVRHSLPYSDLTSLRAEELQQLHDELEPLCFGHTLESILGGQLAAGLQMTAMYEDYWGEDRDNLIDTIMPTMLATRCIKPASDS